MSTVAHLDADCAAPLPGVQIEKTEVEKEQ
jgi:hypothetical protein